MQSRLSSSRPLVLLVTIISFSIFVPHVWNENADKRSSASLDEIARHLPHKYWKRVYWGSATGVTDKSSMYFNYLHYYQRLFASLGSRPTIVELGVDTGPSIAMWATAYPESRIFGVDPFTDNWKLNLPYWETKVNLDNVEIIEGFSYKNDVATKLCSVGVDVIDDDGDHSSGGQMGSFMNLFPCLNEGGVYIIENVNVMFKGDHDTFDYFLQLVARLMRMNGLSINQQCEELKKNEHKWESTIESIEFYPDVLVAWKRNASALYESCARNEKEDVVPVAGKWYPTRNLSKLVTIKSLP